MSKKTPPVVETIGQLMNALHGGKTKLVRLPIKAGGDSLAKRIREGRTGQPAKPPSELGDVDGLMQQRGRYYGKRLGDEVLLKAIAAVAKHKGVPYPPCEAHDLCGVQRGP